MPTHTPYSPGRREPGSESAVGCLGYAAMSSQDLLLPCRLSTSRGCLSPTTLPAFVYRSYFPGAAGPHSPHTESTQVNFANPFPRYGKTCSPSERQKQPIACNPQGRATACDGNSSREQETCSRSLSAKPGEPGPKSLNHSMTEIGRKSKTRSQALVGRSAIAGEVRPRTRPSGRGAGAGTRKLSRPGLQAIHFSSPSLFRSTCPPNWKRMAESILAANSPSPRELNRS